MHYIAVASLFLSVLAKPISSTYRYAKIGEKVELPCSYSTAKLNFGDVLQWVKSDDRGGSATAKVVIGVFNQVYDGWRDAYVMTRNESVYELSIRVLWTNQSGTYRCQYLKDDQVIELAEYRLLAFGGDIQLIDWPIGVTDNVIVKTNNPAQINFTVVSFNDVRDFITFRAGEKDLTSAMSCQAIVDSTGSSTVNTTCSVSTSTVSQSDDGVPLSIEVKLPNYAQSHSQVRTLSVLVPPIVDCPPTESARRGDSRTITCVLRSRGSPSRLVWQHREENIVTLEPDLSYADAEGVSAHLDRQDRSDVVTAKLHIKKVEDSSYGIYTLVATSDVGTASDTVELKVAEAEAVKPSVAKDVSTSGGVSGHSAAASRLLMCALSFFASETFAYFISGHEKKF